MLYIRWIVIFCLSIQLSACKWCIPVKQELWMETSAELISVKKSGSQYTYTLLFKQSHSVFPKKILVEGQTDQPPKIGQTVRLKYLKKKPAKYYLIDQIQIAKPVTVKEPTLGFQSQTFKDSTRMVHNQPRPIHTAIWYPSQPSQTLAAISEPFWKLEKVHVDGKLRFPRKKYPLILLSPGFSGTPFSVAWIAEGLAKKGYIVAAVAHYGNTKGTMLADISVRPWNRPQDISFVLYQLLTNSPMKENIDITKIGTIGFSQGGITALWLAGLQAHLKPEYAKQQFHIDEPFVSRFFPHETTSSIDNTIEQFSEQDYQKANQSYKENFIKAAVALAPALNTENYMFGPAGLSQINIPTLIIDGGSDTSIKTMQWGGYFKDYIQKNKYMILKGSISHFTFLNEGTESAKQQEPMLVLDESSIDRAKIHQQLLSTMDDFFKQYL